MIYRVCVIALLLVTVLAVGMPSDVMGAKARPAVKSQTVRVADLDSGQGTFHCLSAAQDLGIAVFR